MLKTLELGALAIAGACIVALGLLITTTVILRTFSGAGVSDDVTLVSELMVGAIFLPLAYVTANYSHITIDFLFNWMNERVKLWTLAIGSTLSLVILLPLAVAGWNEFAHAVEAGSYFWGDLDLPKWPGRFIFFLGALLFVLRLSIVCIADLRAAIRADADYLVKRTDAVHDTIEES
ncbi:TRAP transporter small permease [uncultured Amphritea sp.]|uniref:TRAP transporter small permease n=1 Tax=uncultured Amphritea sp. TaxID=981605 RepID=UPI0026190ABA|nr:TRAP transporter small permease [uncultured Amphritea sp.]